MSSLPNQSNYGSLVTGTLKVHLVYVVLRTTTRCADRIVVYDTIVIRRKEAAVRSAKEMEQAKLEAETALKEEAERLRKGASIPRLFMSCLKFICTLFEK